MTLCYTLQNIAEFWNVASRPVARNGFGLPVARAAAEVDAIERGMRLLPDTENVYREWRSIVLTHRVSGVQVHDARIAAAMLVHGISHILTLNARDFARYPGVRAAHPSEVV
jgi:predicted nucleic acid-binding protein